VSWKSSYAKLPENKFAILNDYELAASTKPKNDVPLRITGTFKLVYSSANQPTREFLQKFAVRNSTFNSWPYFRELIQSIIQRMNLPLLVLPLLKMPAE